MGGHDRSHDIQWTKNMQCASRPRGAFYCLNDDGASGLTYKRFDYFLQQGDIIDQRHRDYIAGQPNLPRAIKKNLVVVVAAAMASHDPDKGKKRGYALGSPFPPKKKNALLANPTIRGIQEEKKDYFYNLGAMASRTAWRISGPHPTRPSRT